MWGKGLVVGLALLLSAAHGADYSLGRQSEVLVVFPQLGNQCSGAVAVKPMHILTAQHCVAIDIGFGLEVVPTEGRVVIDNHVLAKYEVVWHDDADHALLRVDRLPAGKRVAPMAKREPRVGEQLYVWGHGGGAIKPFLRTGPYTGQKEGDFYIFDLHTEPGDSGSAYFNAAGEIVATNWGYNRRDASMSYAAPYAGYPR